MTTSYVSPGRTQSIRPARQMQVYEARLKSLGKRIHIHWFKAGHGSYAQEQRLEQQELKLRLAYQILA
jgi:hypothetical protein